MAMLLGFIVAALTDWLHLVVGLSVGALLKNPTHAAIGWAVSSTALMVMFASLSAGQFREPHALAFVAIWIANALLVFGASWLRRKIDASDQVS